MYVAEERSRKRRERKTRKAGKVMTLHEYFSTPVSVLPQELIYGAMRVAESPAPRHQAAVGALHIALHEHVARGGLGDVWLSPLDVIFDAERALVLQPDLFVILHGGAASVSERVFGPPDLVIEVLSPRPRIGDLNERVAWFAEYGVRECWLVEQIDRRVQVLQFEAGLVKARRTFHQDEPIASVVLPAFHQTLTSIVGY